MPNCSCPTANFVLQEMVKKIMAGDVDAAGDGPGDGAAAAAGGDRSDY